MKTAEQIIAEIDDALYRNEPFIKSHVDYRHAELHSDLDDIEAILADDYVDFVSTDRFNQERGRTARRATRIA